MKKILLFGISGLLFAGCNINRDVTGKGIPEHVSEIEFWNGGSNIRTYKNADVRIRSFISEGIVGKNISYYFYDVTADGKTESIVDSESLCIVYKE